MCPGSEPVSEARTRPADVLLERSPDPFANQAAIPRERLPRRQLFCPAKPCAFA
jgi:hypothetical protein